MAMSATSLHEFTRCYSKHSSIIHPPGGKSTGRQDSKKEPKKESAGLSPAETKDLPGDGAAWAEDVVRGLLLYMGYVDYWIAACIYRYLKIDLNIFMYKYIYIYR